MAKHGFKMGGSGKTVVVVPESSVDADTVSAVTVGEAPTVIGDAGDVAPAGWEMIEGGVEGTSLADIGSGGTVIVDGVGAVEVVLASEPDVIWTAPLLCAEDDGMGVMQAIEVVTSLTDAVLPEGYVAGDARIWGDLSVAMPVESSVTVDVTATVLDFVASEPVVSPFAALVASHKPIVADCVVRVDLPAMLASDARAMAQRVADMTGVAINVIGPNGVESVAPRRGGGGGGKRVASVVKLTDARSTEITAPREEGTLARCARGVWLDSDVPASNETILTLKHALQTAHGALDLDHLLTLDRKTVSTYYNHARAYRTWAIGDVTRQLGEREEARKVAEAALDAEFGFACAAD